GTDPIVGAPGDAGAADLATAKPPPDGGGAADLAVANAKAAWPMPGHDARHSSRGDGPGPQQGAIRWTAAAHVTGTPLLGGGGILDVGASMPPGVSALSPADGHLLWSTQAGCRALALGPDGTLYVDACSNVPRLCAFDPDQMKVKWCQILAA